MAAYVCTCLRLGYFKISPLLCTGRWSPRFPSSNQSIERSTRWLSSSREEEVVKAREDLKSIIDGIPDTFIDFSDDGEEKTEKTKLGRVGPEDVRFILDYKHVPLPIFKSIAVAERRDKETYMELSVACSPIEFLVKNCDDEIHDMQDRIRHKMETAGYIEYHVTNNKEEEVNENPTTAKQARRGQHRIESHIPTSLN